MNAPARTIQKGDAVRVAFGAESRDGVVTEVVTLGPDPYVWVRFSPQWVHRCDYADVLRLPEQPARPAHWGAA